MSVFDQAVIRTTTRLCGSSDASTPRQESPRTSTQGDIGRPRSRATGTPARISSDPSHAHAPQHPHFPLAQKNKPTKAQSAAPFSFRIVVHQDTRSLFRQPCSAQWTIRDTQMVRERSPNTIHCVTLSIPRGHGIIKP